MNRAALLVACGLACTGAIAPARAPLAGGTPGVLGIALAALGRDGAMRVPRAGDRLVVGSEARVSRGPGVVEWWRSLPSGVEHGVTIERTPAGDGPLILEMSVGAGLRAEGASTITVRDARSDAPLGTYSGLFVVDAEGTAVPSRMAAVGGRIRIEIADGGARYPIIVDPLVVTEGAIIASSVPAADRNFGSAVALSADGSWAMVRSGAGGVGVVHFLSRSGTSWTVVRRHEGWTAESGSVFDLAGDASLAYVYFSGGPGPLFERTGTTWTQSAFSPETACAPPGPVRGVAIDGTGDRIVLTAGPASSPTWMACVLVRSGATWTVEARLTDPTFGLVDAGVAVTMSASGDHLYAGSAFGPGGRLYARSGTTWMLEGTIASMGPARLSGDGSRLAVGLDIWARSGTSWAREATLPGTFDYLRYRSVGLDGDGRRWLGGDRVFVRNGSTWSLGATLSPTGIVSGEDFGVSLAMSADGIHLLVGAPADDVPGDDVNRGTVRHFTVGSMLGDPCDRGSHCLSGFCVDGVCCSTACGASSPTDCMACTAAAGASGPDGTCSPLRASIASSLTCRPSTLPCDRPETCVATSTECPPDTARAGGTVCRPAAGLCDREEMCDGTNFDCALDSYQPSGTACGGSGGGSCASAGSCSGGSPACPGAAPLAAGTPCLPAAAGNPCDIDDVCDGVAQTCPARFAPATVECGGAPSGDCDAQDHCAGTSGDCVPEFLVAVVCRAGTAACDVPEVCLGDAPDCPPDAVAAAGLTCRDSTMSCDPIEVCDGTAATCPDDVEGCGADTGVTADAAGAGTDGGGPSSTAGGCACRARGGRSGVPGLLWVLSAALRVGRRRRG